MAGLMDQTTDPTGCTTFLDEKMCLNDNNKFFVSNLDALDSEASKKSTKNFTPYFQRKSTSSFETKKCKDLVGCRNELKQKLSILVDIYNENLRGSLRGTPK